MTKAAGGCVLHLQESYDTLMDTLDANKTTAAFPVVARCTSGEEQGDFKGIISRARYVGHTCCPTRPWQPPSQRLHGRCLWLSFGTHKKALMQCFSEVGDVMSASGACKLMAYAC